MSVRSKVKDFFHSVRQDKALARKALAVCLLIVFVMTTILVYLLYFASVMETAVFRNMKVAVAQSKDNFDYRMEQVGESAMSLLTTVYPSLNASEPPERQLSEYSEMQRVLNQFEGNHMITKLRFYVPSSKIYSRQRDNFFPLDDLILNSNGEKIPDFKNGQSWIETHDIARTYGEKPIPVISCVSSISSTTEYNRTVGVLFLDVAVSQLNTMLSIGIDGNNSLFLVNANGQVLAHSNALLIGSNAFSDSPEFKFDSPAGTKALTMNGDKSLVAYSRLKFADWYLVLATPRAAAFSSNLYLLNTISLVLILIIISAFVAAVMLTYQMVLDRTVSRIMNVVGQIESKGIGTITEQPDPEWSGSGAVSVKGKRRPYSLSSLETQANHMAMIINALLDRQYKDEISVRDFQMKALQAQINPHFLYNTLDVIKWMIVDGDTKGSVFMVNALSKYFQQSLSKGKDIVRIEEEIELTKTYLGIMQKRFKNKFAAEFNMGPETSACLIPKLSLQPLVENALLHGILYTEKPEPMLSIRVMCEGEFLRIEIEDNGDGIDEDTLVSLQENSAASKTYGLANVRQRLELFGMDKTGFDIFSKKGMGTCISIRLPMRQV